MTLPLIIQYINFLRFNAYRTCNKIKYSNAVFWSLWYLVYFAYTTQQQHQPPSSAPPRRAVDEEKVWLTNLCEVNIYVFFLSIYIYVFCIFQPMINCWFRVLIHHPRKFLWKENLLRDMPKKCSRNMSQVFSSQTDPLRDYKIRLEKSSRFRPSTSEAGPKFYLVKYLHEFNETNLLDITPDVHLHLQKTLRLFNGSVSSFSNNGGSWTTWKSLAPGGFPFHVISTFRWPFFGWIVDGFLVGEKWPYTWKP